MKAAVEGRAFAKVNLDLRVLGTRPDGFHELATVFQTIGLSDHLRVEPAPADRPLVITCNDPEVPCDERNLVWKAAAALWQRHRGEPRPCGARVTLTKSIPAAGGLGGGSSDAAVALVLLARCWGLRVDALEFESLAAGLGSDVTFFLRGGTALGRGRGERLEPQPDLPALNVVLAFPDFGVSTADAYRWFDDERGQTDFESGALEPERRDRSWIHYRNDLEAAVFRRHPVLARAKRIMAEAGAVLALMSGSGSTVFGLFEADTTAAAAAVTLQDAGLATLNTRTVSRAEYQRTAFGVV
ncbi:MAG: 4-(cytidine 5'-diphospho)-2-C-methyl-D-erythritol kinase [Vicinamibacterales bacterium]